MILYYNNVNNLEILVCLIKKYATQKYKYQTISTNKKYD
jgi:hypothetical protein